MRTSVEEVVMGVWAWRGPLLKRYQRRKMIAAIRYHQ